jgi:hypothetical protein
MCRFFLEIWEPVQGLLYLLLMSVQVDKIASKSWKDAD